MGKRAIQAKVDEFGRVVIPKTTRSRFGLKAGSVLEITGDEQGIVLRPGPEKPFLKAKDGVLVFTGTAAADWEGAVRRLREKRTAALTPRSKR
jgi:AbrB family looped-hinge helix DNA binding protein